MVSRVRPPWTTALALVLAAAGVPALPNASPAQPPAPDSTASDSAASDQTGAARTEGFLDADTADKKPSVTESAGPHLLNDGLGCPDSRLRAWGWIQNSFTGNPAFPANGVNFGVTPNSFANRWMGNQYYLILERTLGPKDEVSVGFRLDNLFGNDASWNHMHQLLDNAFPPGQFAAYDPAQFYGELHLPVFTDKGLDLRFGRWYGLGGYEGLPAIARPLLSVPYLFNYGQPFTHLGALATLHCSDDLKIWNAAINGWDRFFNEHYVWGYLGGFTWNLPDKKTTLAFTFLWGPNQFPTFLPATTPIFPTGYVNVPSLAGQPNPGYAHHDRNLFTTVVTHKWTDKLTQVFEADQGFEKDIPGLASGGQNGLPASDSWYGLANWFLYDLTDRWQLVWRAEWFRDTAGARMGNPGPPGNYYEQTLGAVYRPHPRFWIRPEARYDWARPATPYNGGVSASQFTLAADALFIF